MLNFMPQLPTYRARASTLHVLYNMKNTRKHTLAIRLACIALLVADGAALVIAGHDQSMGGLFAVCCAACAALTLLCTPSTSRFSR